MRILAAVPLTALGFGRRKPMEKAPLVLVNGNVTTFDPEVPGARGLAIVQKDEKARPCVRPSARVIDIGGNQVVPGIIDAQVQFQNACALLLDAVAEAKPCHTEDDKCNPST